MRQLSSARQLDLPTLNDHIPSLLDELAAALDSNSDETIQKSLRKGSPPAHGIQRVHDGFNIEEVVAEYNILRECIHDLANENGLSLQGKPFHILNRVLDGAIGLAVQTYSIQQALEVQRRREEYLAFVAHDLRTPINAISLASRVLEMTIPPQNARPESVQMLKTLGRNVLHLSELVSRILDENSSLQTEVGVKLQRRSFDLWPLVESLIHDLHPVAGTSSTRLVNRVPDDLVVYADASLLRRVYQNLIANAIKYTPRGEIVLDASPQDSGGIECRVSDNGSGISPELIDKIFDKGETDPEKGGGLGLGLAIVRTFIEAHGGEVNVESRAGLGTTFRFTLPGRPSRGA